MKTKTLIAVPLLTALSLPVNLDSQSKPNDPQMVAFLEGLCTGLIIGIVVDTAIICGINCYKQHQASHPPPPYEPPPWIGTTNNPPPPPPPPTNGPPPTITDTNRVVVSGDAAAWTPAPAPYLGMFSTVLESNQGTNWTTLYQITGWKLPAGVIVLVRDPHGSPILTNYGAAIQSLPLPLPQNKQCLFRLREP